MNNSDEGMGLSVVVYAIAMMCGLALFVLPVVWANSARVYDNPGVTANRAGGPVRADNRPDYPLAALHSPQIVSPAMLAELNAKATKEKPTRHASSKPAPRHYAQAEQRDDAAEPRRRRGFFLFSWF